MPDLINLILIIGMDAGILPAITPQEIFNYLQKETANVTQPRYCDSIQPSGNPEQYIGTPSSTTGCSSRDASLITQDSQQTEE